jgi:hypothetical protein
VCVEAFLLLFETSNGGSNDFGFKFCRHAALKNLAHAAIGYNEIKVEEESACEAKVRKSKNDETIALSH